MFQKRNKGYENKEKLCCMSKAVLEIFKQHLLFRINYILSKFSDIVIPWLLLQLYPSSK